LLIKTEQASQAEVVHQLGVSNLEKKWTKYLLASSNRQTFFKSGHPQFWAYIANSSEIGVYELERSSYLERC